MQSKTLNRSAMTTKTGTQKVEKNKKQEISSEELIMA